MTGEAERHYFDHNASAPLLPEARAALLAALERPGNPSSVHAEGRHSRSLVEQARRQVAALVGADAEGVVFTGGASEAANAALSPLWHRGGRAIAVERLAVVATDHPCTRTGGRFAAEATTVLPVDRHGILDPAALAQWVAQAQGRRSLLAITLANNESGVIQPLAPIAQALHGSDVIFVVDAVQGAGRLSLNIGEIGADALILSGHKIGAPIGIGALVLRDPFFFPAPLVIGGGQERGHRAGTIAAPAVAAFGAAAKVAAARSAGDLARLLALRTRLEGRLAACGDVSILGSGAERLANTIFFSYPGLRAETAQIALDLKGFSVSGGSACSSGKVAQSPVLAAHAKGGLPIDPAAGAIRISFGFETGEAEIDAMASAIEELVARLAPSQPVRRAAGGRVS